MIADARKSKQMSSRPLFQRQYPLPAGFDGAPAQLPLTNVFHMPGQAAAGRFFDPDSDGDLYAMREILGGKQSRRWLDDATSLSRTEYREWAGTATPFSYLFAVLDARLTDPEEMRQIRGFVWIYSEREEKIRFSRLQRIGVIPPSTRQRYLLEVSFAVRPSPDGVQLGSGLMSSALRLSCLQVQMLLQSHPDEPEVEILAFTNPENLPSQRTLEAAGFVKKTTVKYSWDSPEDTFFYMLSWQLLNQKVRQKLLEVYQAND